MCSLTSVNDTYPCNVVSIFVVTKRPLCVKTCEIPRDPFRQPSVTPDKDKATNQTIKLVPSYDNAIDETFKLREENRLHPPVLHTDEAAEELLRDGAHHCLA